MATPQASALEESAYRQAERRYRVRRVPFNAKQTRFARAEPDLAGVLDFGCSDDDAAASDMDMDTDPRGRRLGPDEADMRRLRLLGGGGEPRVYALRGRPGCFYIADALGPKAQARWARVCLARFSR